MTPWAAYLGYDIEPVCDFDMAPWGWRVAVLISRTGSSRRAFISCAGIYADPDIAADAGMAYGRLWVREHATNRRGPLSGLDE
jgi:hypothetical protein